MIKLCCFFNYPPLYRESIYKEIDRFYDTQFYFGREVEGQKNSRIKKLNFNIFKNRPIEFDNVMIAGKYLWRRKLLRLIFSKYDVIILTGDFCWTYLPFLLLCKLTKKRVFAWGHGEKSNTRKAWRFEKKIYDWLTGYFTYGDGGRNRLIEFGIPQDKLHVIYNSLVEKVDREANAKLKDSILKNHFKNEYPIVLFIGRLTPQKRLSQLIEMQYIHFNQDFHYNLLIIGDGKEKETLENMAAKYGLCNYIWFYGECYDEKYLNTLIFNSDLCVSPGNVGLTALHVMQYGVPVITHDDFELQMPEYEAIIPSKTGLLFRLGSLFDMAETVKNWLTNYSSQTQREIIRQNCYDVIDSHFNSVYQINLLKKILSE